MEAAALFRSSLHPEHRSGILKLLKREEVLAADSIAPTLRWIAEKYGHPRSSEIGFLRDTLPEAEIGRVPYTIPEGSARSYEIRRTSNSNEKET